ncbi:unnamed protein product [Eruca vesicaria subsp. sativa]|uniref:Cystatin domain-containing protein n=1 Tax=Eruca vesicaria subsp. sativa TaxID=29727 RepID=A0ABC8LBH3_ERUVS|nr:unnamed protein product [Eruca vesicaria subsp. sativa]
MNKAIFFFLIFLVLLPLHMFALRPLQDQWSPVKDAKDPHIIKIGEFAVSEYARLNEVTLKFVTVVSGDIQIVSNVKYYKLVVTANNGGNNSSKNYETVVWVLKSILEIMDFKPLF